MSPFQLLAVAFAIFFQPIYSRPKWMYMSTDPCVSPKVATNNKHKSSYTFSIHASLEKIAQDKKLNKVGLRQYCSSAFTTTSTSTDTDNWAYADLTYAPQTITIEIDRCKKGEKRMVDTYSIRLCDHKNKCPKWIGPRFDIDVNKSLYQERQICNNMLLKAVNVTDPTPWV